MTTISTLIAPGLLTAALLWGGATSSSKTALQSEWRRKGAEHDRTIFIPTLLRYGFAAKWEARVEGNSYTWKRQDDPQKGTTDINGLAPTSVGLKYNFYDAVGSKRPWVGAIIRIFPPSGSGQYRNEKTTADFRMAADWNLADKWSLNPNVGIAVYQGDSALIYEAGLLAMTLNFNPSKKLNFFADTGIQTPEQKAGETSVIFDVGSAYIIGHNTQLDLSVGTGVKGSLPPHPFMAAGFSRRF